MPTSTPTLTPPASFPGVPASLTDTNSFAQTMLFTLILVVLFYLLLIRPQQKRYKEHAAMLGKLAVDDRIVTQGGMVGTISALPNDKEALVDFGGGTKMTVLRSSIMSKYEMAVAEKKDRK